MILPVMWISKCFSTENYDIIACNFEIPKQLFGNRFYHGALKTLCNVSKHEPQNEFELYSMPIWYNKSLQTTFYKNLFDKGFSLMKDLFPENNLINQNYLDSRLDLDIHEKNVLLSIRNAIPRKWVDLAMTSQIITPIRFLKLNLKNGCINIFNCENKQIYLSLIETKIQVPIGFERLCLENTIKIEHVKQCFKIAKSATSNVFLRCFQYKILCQILPCQEYLFKYKVEGVENNHCLKCIERDTVEHCLYDCEKVQPFIVLLENWIKGKSEYKNINISRNLLIFGVLANYENHLALNHILQS